MHRDFLDQLQQARFSMFKPTIIIKENKTAQGEPTLRLRLHEYTVKLMTYSDNLCKLYRGCLLSVRTPNPKQEIL